MEKAKQRWGLRTYEQLTDKQLTGVEFRAREDASRSIVAKTRISSEHLAALVAELRRWRTMPERLRASAGALDYTGDQRMVVGQASGLHDAADLAERIGRGTE